MQIIISRRVAESLSTLPPNLRAWAETHLVTPHAVKLFLGMSSEDCGEFWVVTDNTGADDSSYRVIYHPQTNRFGLAVTLNDGRECLLGLYGSFAESVEAM